VGIQFLFFLSTKLLKKRKSKHSLTNEVGFFVYLLVFTKGKNKKTYFVCQRVKKRRDEAAESCTIDGESPVVKNFLNLENPE
jgi:hypothetical protein